MKYFVIILLSLSLTSPVYAAKMVTGNVPHVQPLQPPPIGVVPNYGGNVRHFEPGRGGEAVSTTSSGPSVDTGQAVPSGGAAESPGGPGAGSSPSPWTVLIILIVFGTGGLGYWVYSRRSPE